MPSLRLALAAATLFAFTCPSIVQGQMTQVQPQSQSQSQSRPRPAPGNQQGGNNGRPQVQPQRPNPGRPPQRPNPGTRPPSRPTPSRPPHHRPTRPPQWGHRPPQRPSYSFRPGNQAYLHRYYLRRLAQINRARRIRLIIGGFFPYANIAYISALPPDVYGQLPPPPHGYAMGYYQGYVVVYDPVTFYIANVIDLLQ